MPSASAGSVSVIDFRRHGMVLRWHPLGGTWTALDDPPTLLHGVALIRPSQPNICIYGQDGRLLLQIGARQFELSEHSPRIRCTRGMASFGLRRSFSVESTSGGVLFSHSYWTNQGEDFFRWLASRAQEPGWRVSMGRRWTAGLPAAELRGA